MRWRQLALVATLCVLLGLLASAVLMRPSNQRDWEFGMDTLPQITIQGDSVTVHNVRDFRYTAEGTRSTNYIDRALDVEQIERVWFVEEPFTIAPFTDFKGVAHTYFVFDFQDQAPLAISVEARRERGEAYDAVRGLFNQYELIYIWGTEEDLTGRRGVLEQNPLYMYPLTIPIESARKLFLQLAEASHQLETHPRFYNTLTSNCTNELANAANQVKPGAIPLDLALIFPGYSDELLYKLGFIPHDLALEEISQRYYVSDIVKADYEKANFSEQLRAELEKG